MANQANKIAVVTGGSRGLGRDMALQMADKGIDVIITYHTKQDEAQKVVNEIAKKGGKAAALQLNVADAESFDQFAANVKTVLKENWGTESIDALVNNAGTGLHATFMDTTPQQFDEMVDIHLKAPFFLSQKLVPLMTNGGSIVNISSGLARFSFTGYDAYATMKGGVETLSRYQAKLLGQKGIRVNTVAPGAIETDFGGGAVRDNKELNQTIAASTALGRVGLPDDIGGVVAFLCSDESKWVNAQRIEVSGGMLI